MTNVPKVSEVPRRAILIGLFSLLLSQAAVGAGHFSLVFQREIWCLFAFLYEATPLFHST